MGVEISLESMTSLFGISWTGSVATLPGDADGSDATKGGCGALSLFSALTFMQSINKAIKNCFIVRFKGKFTIDLSVFLGVVIISACSLGSHRLG